MTTFPPRAVLIFLIARAIAAPVAQAPLESAGPIGHGLVFRVCAWPAQEFRLGVVTLQETKAKVAETLAYRAPGSLLLDDSPSPPSPPSPATHPRLRSVLRDPQRLRC